MFTAILLPMPLVALDPQFTIFQILLALFGPLTTGIISKDVLEPLLIGHSTSLHPVALLLSILVWGSVWGVTGMVLAVPMTAAMRIYLSSAPHPLPRYLASVLSGQSLSADATRPQQSVELV
jgi:AI-2 transport protein TqsA